MNKTQINRICGYLFTHLPDVQGMIKTLASWDRMARDHKLSTGVSMSDEDKLSMILAYLENVLSPEELSEVQHILKQGDPDDESYSEEGLEAVDEPPPFPGKRPGGPIDIRRGAMDRLPPNLRQRVATAVLKTRSAGADTYAQHFPTATRIKVL